MSASTVSVTANQGPTTRRRAVEKNIPSGGASDLAAAVFTESETPRTNAGDTAAAILRDARRTSTTSQVQAKKSGAAKKAAKPRWLTLISILTKNLALVVVLLGFVQMVRWTVVNSGRDIGDLSIMSGDFEGKLSEVENFVTKSMKAMQVQMNSLDRKIDDGVDSVRKELGEKIERNAAEVDLKLKALDVRSDAFEKFMDGFGGKSLLSREEFNDFFEEFKKSRKVSGDSSEVSVDEIRKYASEIVLREIEKHSADGLGMVDYALVSGGARVIRHSEPYGGKTVGGVALGLMQRSRVSPEAEKMIRPSLGEPGQCFALKGGSGFVEIRLRGAIVPEAVTLEHVAKSVAYDRSSAPKHCRVSGWLQTEPEAATERMFLLTEFTYDLEKSNAQTYKVEPSASNLVDIIRLDFTSNHGSASHTCIYRLRVHGRQPSPVPALETQS